jgi:hypothetical protein
MPLPSPNGYGIIDNPLVFTPFTEGYEPSPTPFPSNVFLLLNGGNFLLLNGGNLLLL